MTCTTITTKGPAVAKIADHNGCQVTKVDDFHVIWKPICDVLSMINSKLGFISHRLATIVRDGLQGHPRSMISI